MGERPAMKLEKAIALAYRREHVALGSVPLFFACPTHLPLRSNESMMYPVSELDIPEEGF